VPTNLSHWLPKQRSLSARGVPASPEPGIAMQDAPAGMPGPAG